MLLAIRQKQFNLEILQAVMQSTLRVTSMVFLIFIGASLFSLIFRGFGGDEFVRELLTDLPGGVVRSLPGGVLILIWRMGESLLSAVDLVSEGA